MSENSPQKLSKIQHHLPPNLLHDLRTPLGHVLGYAELLRQQIEDGGHSELLPFLQKIHTAGEQLVALIDENFQGDEPSRK